MKVGFAIGSTGGNKLGRTVRTLSQMEPEYPIHVVLDVASKTWKNSGLSPSLDWLEYDKKTTVLVRPFENSAHINGTLNECMRWLQELGYTHVCLFHDDLVFSPLPEHVGSISKWFDSFLLDPSKSSGIKFSQFETFVPDEDSRRHPDEWDKEDLRSPELWKFLKCHYSQIDGSPVCPPEKSFWFKYEGSDKVRKWNRLGPAGQVVPIETWEKVGGFDETEGIFYDGEYPSECFRRGLPPIWAVTNFPFIHLHNQSMNPWFDPAPGLFGDTMKAYAKRFPGNHNKPDAWAAFWGDTWEEEWH